MKPEPVMSGAWRENLRGIVPEGMTILAIFALLQGLLWVLHTSPVSRPNIEWWTAISTLASDRGFFNVWTPYPPLFPTLHYALFHAVGADPGTLAAHFFRGDPSGQTAAAQAVSTLRVVWIVLNALLLAGQSFLIYHIARPNRPRPDALLAASAFALFHLTWPHRMSIGITADQFDALPNFFFLLSLLLLIQHRHTGSALAAGVGTMLKIYPALAIPLAWAHLKTARRALIYTALAAILSLAIAAPFLWVNADIFLTTWRWTATRAGWESVWTYPEKKFPPTPSPQTMPGLFDLPFYETILVLHNGENSPGRVVEERPGSILFEFLDGQQEEIPKLRVRGIQEVGRVATKYRILMLATVAALLGLTWCFRHALQKPEALLRGAILSVIVLLFFSKGVSHYFVVWFFPLLFVVYRPAVAALLVTLFLLVGHLEFLGDPVGLPGYWPGIFLRQGLFLCVAFDQGRSLWKMERDASRLEDPAGRTLLGKPDGNESCLAP